MHKADLKQDKKMVAGAVHKHEKKLHPGQPMTCLQAGQGRQDKCSDEIFGSRFG